MKHCIEGKSFPYTPLLDQIVGDQGSDFEDYRSQLKYPTVDQKVNKKRCVVETL